MALLAELERLIDEYYEAAQRRSAPRRRCCAAAILEQARAAGLDRDCGIAAGEDDDDGAAQARRPICAS